jgi:pilus assembly protein Flp/PilA
MKDITVGFLHDEDGLTMVEYAVAGSLVTAALVLAFTLLGTQISAVINYLAGIINPPAA